MGRMLPHSSPPPPVILGSWDSSPSIAVLELGKYKMGTYLVGQVVLQQKKRNLNDKSHEVGRNQNHKVLPSLNCLKHLLRNNPTSFIYGLLCFSQRALRTTQ